MRVLLDENLDHRLRRDFGPDFEVFTVEFQGWKGTRNGVLLRLAAAEFDAFVTLDRGIEYEQAWHTLNLGIVLLIAASSRYADIRPFIPLIEEALHCIEPGKLLRVP